MENKNKQLWKLIIGMLLALIVGGIAISYFKSVESKEASKIAVDEVIDIKHNVQEKAQDAVNEAVANINLDSVILKSGKRFIYLDHITFRDFAYAVDSSGQVIGRVVSMIPIDTLKSRYKGYTKTEFYNEIIRKDTLK